MTDARFPERWLNDRRLMRLAPVDFKSYVVSLAYAVANRTDGRLDLADLEACPGFTLDSIPRLVSAAVWVERDAGVWGITEYLTTQTTRAQLDAAQRARESGRARVARYRARHAESDMSAGSEPVTRDVTGESTRTGQDRPGQDELPPRFARDSEHDSSSFAPDDDAPDLEALARDGWATPAPEHAAPHPAPAPPAPDDDGPPEWAHIRAAAAALGHTLGRRESERPAPVVPPAYPGGIGWDFDPDLYA